MPKEVSRTVHIASLTLMLLTPQAVMNQIALAAAWAAGYVAWAYAYYRALDPAIRHLVGKALGVRVVWSYDARQYFQRGRYRRWHWGIADAPADRVIFNEFLVNMLGIATVNVVAGLWPIALLYLAMVRHLAGPWALYAGVLLTIPIYAIYWSGRHQPPVDLSLQN